MTIDKRGVKTIYVDLDHTLICIDLLRSRLVSILLRQPLALFQVIYWIYRGGPVRLKAELAARYPVDPARLPYNADLLEFLRASRAAGQRLVLATAAPRPWAEAVAAHLNLFDHILATTPETGNMKGRRKLEFIQRDANGEPFGYAGDAEADRPILEAAQLPIVVGATADLAGKNKEIALVLPRRPHQSGLGTLLGWTLGAMLLIFIVLEFWRPCYFLTDDNLSSGWPIFTEIGRHLKAGQSPFIFDYLYGGHYNALRDMSCQAWHPFFLALSLFADTPARFWTIDLFAFLNLLITVTGFTVLAHRLRREFSLPIPDGYLIFYTLSFVFSTFLLTVGSSWAGFLATQSCLPWLALGILQERPMRGTFLITLVTIHELLGGYFGLLVSSSLCLSIFALGVAVARRSIRPLFCWGAGYMIALLVLAPFWVVVLDGFSHTTRILGMSLDALTIFSIPPGEFLNSFFFGNWSELLARWHGDTAFNHIGFPLSSIMACAAAWCVWPALFGPGRWCYMDKLCLGLALGLLLLIIRPYWLAVVMQHLPVFRSLRWPFREGVLFLFFIHLFLILRFPAKPLRWQNATAIFSFLVFALPLLLINPPSLNPVKADRQLLFSGRAEAFWNNVKPMLQPGDEIATVIDIGFWDKYRGDVPYSLLGTANYPSAFQVRSISGYSTTAPADQVPFKIMPHYWFGAFSEDQVGELLAQYPHLKLIRIVSVHPYKVTMSTGNGPAVDLTPYLPK